MHHTHSANGGFNLHKSAKTNIISRNVHFSSRLPERYLLMCALSMSTVFSSGHGNMEGWLSCTSRKCCKDNRMCPGSAVEGRRIQGSYCTLWNGPRNARCLPFLFFLFFFFFRSGSYHMLEATGFEDNVNPAWYMCDTVLARGCLRSPTSTFSSDSLTIWNLPRQSLGPRAHESQRQAGWKTCHVEIYVSNADLGLDWTAVISESGGNFRRWSKGGYFPASCLVSGW